MVRRRTAEPAQDDPDEPSSRDFVMARLAAARICAQIAIDSIDEAMSMFVNPADDKRGDKRTEAVEQVLEQLGCATRAAECAEEAMPEVDPAEQEPWDE